MSRVAYVNGTYHPHGQAVVHIEDRGFQFADGVYEVCEVSGGFIIDRTRHLDRLDRSLSELAMAWPVGRDALGRIMIEVTSRNRVRDGLVYLQVTRGNPGDRDFAYPPKDTPPTVVMFTTAADAFAGTPFAPPIVTVTVPPAGIRTFGAPIPYRVSNTRTGVTPEYAAPAG